MTSLSSSLTLADASFLFGCSEQPRVPDLLKERINEVLDALWHGLACHDTGGVLPGRVQVSHFIFRPTIGATPIFFHWQSATYLLSLLCAGFGFTPIIFPSRAPCPCFVRFSVLSLRSSYPPRRSIAFRPELSRFTCVSRPCGS